METVITKHKDSTTYEEFIARVYSPIAMRSPFCVGSTASSVGGGEGSNQSTLAAALLDSHGHSHKATAHRAEQKFTGENGKCRVSAFCLVFNLPVSDSSSRGVWFNNSDIAQNVESTSISPRPLKKLSTSLKGVPRRTFRHDVSLESPPDSPPQLVRKK